MNPKGKFVCMSIAHLYYPHCHSISRAKRAGEKGTSTQGHIEETQRQLTKGRKEGTKWIDSSFSLHKRSHQWKRRREWVSWCLFYCVSACANACVHTIGHNNRPVRTLSLVFLSLTCLYCRTRGRWERKEKKIELAKWKRQGTPGEMGQSLTHSVKWSLVLSNALDLI